MNTSLVLFLGVGFVAVVLLLEGLYVYWSDTRSPEARRMNERLRAMTAGGLAPREKSGLLKQRVLSHHPGLQRLLQRIPSIVALDRMMFQAGSGQTVHQLLSICALAAAAGLLLAVLLGWSWAVGLAVSLGLGLLPLLHLLRKRSQRLQQLEAQLPEAMDLISRALRAGHAFPSAMGMVASEAPDPIAGEFRVTTDEIGFGISIDDALNNLASRVPNDDMRYFAMAVIIQRETGGNLSELLGKLADLVRQRFLLFAKVRGLTAEGRLSAYILIGLPFCVAAVIQVTNPGYLAPLFQDPAGIRLVYGALALMLIGIFVMWRIIHIKV